MSKESMLQLILAGTHELCIGKRSMFIRNVITNTDKSSRVFHVTSDQADEIIAHPCVTLTLEGSLMHYTVRGFPRKEEVADTSKVLLRELAAMNNCNYDRQNEEYRKVMDKVNAFLKLNPPNV